MKRSWSIAVVWRKQWNVMRFFFSEAQARVSHCRDWAGTANEDVASTIIG